MRRRHWTDTCTDTEITYRLDAWEDEAATYQADALEDAELAHVRALLADTRRALVVGDDDLPECVLARLRQQRDDLIAELGRLEARRERAELRH